jgi:predicted MFS family arabinose efflux permease
MTTGSGANPLSRSPWLILTIVLLAGVAAALNQFKVPPVMPLLMESLGQTAGQAGLLMSVFAFTGLLLALPSGFILQKLGYRSTGVVALFFVAAGAALGIFSNGFPTLLLSRLVEGAGLSLIAVTAPEIVALRFAPEKRGKAMAIWSVWMPFGSVAMFILAPLFATRWGWRGVWEFALFYTVAVGALFYLLVKPRAGAHEQSEACRNLTVRSMGRIMRNRNLWLVSLVFCCFNFVVVSFVTWAPTFLHEARHASLVRASHMMAVASITSMAAAQIAGWVLDRTRASKVISAAPLLALAAIFPLAPTVGGNAFLLPVAATGLMAGFIPTTIFSGATDIVGDERLAGMAMAVIQIGQNTGVLLGPLVTGLLIESWGWQVAFSALAPVAVVGAVTGMMADFSRQPPLAYCET